MIQNFEHITEPLTEEEKKLIPILINGFKTKTKENSITGSEVVDSINRKKESLGLTKNFSEPRLRKLTNFIRSAGILPIIATSNGYYVSYDKDEIRLQITSLEERAAAILNSANGLKKYL